MFSRLFAKKDDEVQLADHCWRMSVLLLKLLETDENSHKNICLVTNKAFDWIRTDSSENKAIGLNVLRFLFKRQDIIYSRDLLEEVLDIFLSNTTLAVKLAALDFLGAMNTTPNPMTRVSTVEAGRIARFRSNLMEYMNTSQRDYVTDGVNADIAREITGKTFEQALINVISKIDS